MAGIYDTLAQARLDTAALGADAEKAARGAEAWKKAQAIKAAADTAKAAPAAAGPWYSNPTRSIGLPAVSPKAAGIGAKALGVAGRAATIAAPAIEAGRTAMVAASPTMTGADVAEQGFGGAGKLATAGLGATGGAALGAMTGPAAPIAVPLGALVGGALGYYGGGAAISGAKRMLGLDPRTPYERLPESAAPMATPPGAALALAPATGTPMDEGVRAPKLEFVESDAPIPSPTQAFGAVARPAPVRDTFVNRAVPGSLASFFGASMNQKRLATSEAQNIAAAEAQASRDMEAQKINATLAAATNVSPKEQAEAAILQERQRLAAAETDPTKKYAILGGYSPPAGAQPKVLDTLSTPGSGAVVMQQGDQVRTVPIRPAPQATIESLRAYAKAQGKTMTDTQLRSTASAQGIQVTN